MRDTDSHSVNHHHQNSLQLLPNDNSLQYCWVIVVSWSFYCLIKSESLLDSLITWNSLQSGCHHQELTAHHVRFLRIKLTENIQKDQVHCFRAHSHLLLIRRKKMKEKSGHSNMISWIWLCRKPSLNNFFPFFVCFLHQNDAWRNQTEGKKICLKGR